MHPVMLLQLGYVVLPKIVWDYSGNEHYTIFVLEGVILGPPTSVKFAKPWYCKVRAITVHLAWSCNYEMLSIRLIAINRVCESRQSVSRTAKMISSVGHLISWMFCNGSMQ